MSTQLSGEPRVVNRAEQPYVAIRGVVTMRTIPEIADRFPEIFGWLSARGIDPAGAPFLKYNVIDMERQLDIEAGVPVATTVEGSDPIRPGVLPSGRFATVTHVGPFDQLIHVTRDLLDWAAERGLEWDMAQTAAGERWGCRLESYETDPNDEPDMSKWKTVLAFRLAG
jgi:effector-binding domain-containing protein